MRGDVWEKLARLGYAARGVVYVVLGALAVLAALGRGSAPDARGALTTVLDQPAGKAILGVLALGLACFALWRVAQAALDADHLGTGRKALLRRAGFAGGAAANASLAVSALLLATARGGGGGGGDSAARDWTAWLLSMPFGQWLVALAGAVVIGAGLGAAAKAWTGSFTQHLSLDAATRRWAVPMGRLGYAARAAVFGLIGLFLVLAAWHASARQAKGLSGALRALQDQPYGSTLLLVTAAGLLAFGAFQFVIARHRRIDVPDPARAPREAMARMRGMLPGR